MFFELEAAELLLCMPNNYWFWKAVYGGFVKAGVRGARKPIPLSCVAEGLAEVRRIYGVASTTCTWLFPTSVLHRWPLGRSLASFSYVPARPTLMKS